MSTPMHTRCLLAALNAPAHTLRRCRGGFRDNATPLVVHTRRTANALVDAGDATFDDGGCPSALTLTAAGIGRAQLLAGAKVAA